MYAVIVYIAVVIVAVVIVSVVIVSVVNHVVESARIEAAVTAIHLADICWILLLITNHYFLGRGDEIDISLTLIVTNWITSVTQLLFVSFNGGIIVYFSSDQSADILTALIATQLTLTIVTVIQTTVVTVSTAVGAICTTIRAEATIITVPVMLCDICGL